MMAEFEMDFKRPLKNTRVDYFVLFNVKKRRLSDKIWICLMTCLTTRAVYLGVPPDLSNESMFN